MNPDSQKVISEHVFTYINLGFGITREAMRPRFDGHWMNEYKRELELAVQARAAEHEQL